MPELPMKITHIHDNNGCCQLCGKNKELRPYGPGGKWVCFDCMKLDEDEGKRQFLSLIDGDDITIIGPVSEQPHEH